MLIFSTYDFWLFANFWLHVKHTGLPVLSAMKANEFVYKALNVLCSSDTFLFLRFAHSWVAITKLSF